MPENHKKTVKPNSNKPVVRIGCAHAQGEGSQAQTSFTMAYDDFADMQDRATERAKKNISSEILVATSTGKGSKALASGTLIPRGIKSEEKMVALVEKGMDAAAKLQHKQLESQANDHSAPASSNGNDKATDPATTPRNS